MEDKSPRGKTRVLRFYGRYELSQVYDHRRETYGKRIQKIYDARLFAKIHGRVQRRRNDKQGRVKRNETTAERKQRQHLERVRIVRRRKFRKDRYARKVYRADTENVQRVLSRYGAGSARSRSDMRFASGQTVASALSFRVLRKATVAEKQARRRI